MRRIARPAWLDEGEEPDYRFTLANERTYLAWLRTALALLAAAVVLHQLQPAGLLVPVRWLSPGFAGLAGLAVGLGFMRWRSYEIAMRHRRTLPAGLGLLALALLMAVAAALTTLAVLPGWP